MTDPDIQVRGKLCPTDEVLPMVYTPVIGSSLSVGPVLTFHDTVQARSGSGLSFIRRVKANAFGNVTIKVTGISGW